MVTKASLLINSEDLWTFKSFSDLWFCVCFLVCSTIFAGFICAGPSWVRSLPCCSWKMLYFLFLNVWSRYQSVVGGMENTCWRFLVALICISLCFHARVRVGGCMCTTACTRGDFQSQNFICCHCHTFTFLYISEFFILKGWAKAPSVCILKPSFTSKVPTEFCKWKCSSARIWNCHSSL